MSEAFLLSMEVCNILNLNKINETEILLPSETKFSWSQESFNRFKTKLEELKTLIKYDEVNGTANEPYEAIWATKGFALQEAETATTKELTDAIYSSIYHYSDRWSLAHMAYVVSYVEELERKLTKEKIL